MSKPDDTPLVIDHGEYRGATVLTVSGAVGKDVGTVRQQLPPEPIGAGPVMVDLESATLLHRAGFEQLMFELEAFSAGRRLCVVCRRPSALRLLRSWDADRLVEVFLTMEGALGRTPKRVTSPSGGDNGPAAGAHSHVVEFYESDRFLVQSVREFVAPALSQDDAVVVVATEPHRLLFEAALMESGLDVESARTAGRYVDLDADDTVSSFMVDGAPDPSRFEAVLAGIIDGAASRGRRVRVYGEMVAVLWAVGNVSAAIAVEDLWNKLGRSRRFLLFCAYPLAGFDHDDSGGAFHTICEQHTAVIPTERYSNLGDADKRVRAVALMQQEAAAALTERERLEGRVRELEELATMDPLTGLSNRLCFLDRLEQVLALARREAWGVAVLSLDLDRFQDVNHSLGHLDDQLLLDVSGRLRSVLRQSDTLARLGGDEFAVLLPGPTSAQEATAAARRVVESFRTGFDDDGAPSVRCSVGISVGSDGCGIPAELLQSAGVAMCQAKESGGDRFEMFQPDR